MEKAKLVFHYAVRATVREDDAFAMLRRWMAGNQTIKDLDKKATIERASFQLFPMWLIRADQKGEERLLLEPAAALSVSELKQLTVPASDLEPYDYGLDESAIEATIPYKAMLSWLQEENAITEAEIKETAIVHIPIYQMKYMYKDRRYTAVVDAASGRVFANIFPAKWEAPYLAIGAAAFAAYFCAAMIPVGGFLFGDAGGLGLGVLIYAAVAAALAIPFFSAAAAISAKV